MPAAGADGQEPTGGSQKAPGKRGNGDCTLQVRLSAYNWPHTGLGAWARREPDVSRVTL